MWDGDERKGEGETRCRLIACSSRKHQGGHQVNVPIRWKNRYQQYYMPSQHTYCGRVWNLIQDLMLLSAKSIASVTVLLFTWEVKINLIHWCRHRLFRGYHTLHWIQGLQVQTQLGSMDFSACKNPEYDFLKREESRGSHVVDLRHVKEPRRN